MSIDERIEKLVASQERLSESQAKTEVLLANIVDSIQRLERIALSHEVRVQDVEAALAALEGRQRKPQ
jgi:hypothetical protein